MRGLATVKTLTSGDYLVHIHNLRGMSAGWDGEKQPRPETEGDTYAEIKIPVFEQYANPKTTQKALDDISLIDFANDIVTASQISSRWMKARRSSLAMVSCSHGDF